MTLRDRSASLALRTYKLLLSPVLHTLGGAGGACRFHPTCSEYAAIAVREHGWLRGAGMALWRVLRCQPFCRGGFDPVPPKKADSISHPQSKALHRAH